METIRILMAATAVALADALEAFTVFATVEAEYGDELVEGSSPELTLAHHGSRSDNLPPCVGGNVEVEGLQAVGLSHLDLDAIGGVMRLLGCKGSLGSPRDAFWRIAGQVDVRGIHHLDAMLQQLASEVESCANGNMPSADFRDAHAEYGRAFADRVSAKLHAWWAWSEDNRLRLLPPQDGSAADMTDVVMEAVGILDAIFDGDEGLLNRGQKWKEEKEALEAASFVRAVSAEGGPVVLLRQSEQFTNHLYAHPGAAPAAGVVAYNSLRGTVTLSLADPIEGVSCCEIAQQLWGPDAGGHAGIAGSPREGGLSLADAERAAVAMAEALS